MRLHDFTTLSRSTTLASPTDRAATVARLARALLTDLDTSGGVRLLGVGVSGLADWIQEDLFGETGTEDDEEAAAARGGDPAPLAPRLGARHGRRARRARPRLGVGLGPRRGDRPVRDGRDPRRTGALVPPSDPALSPWPPPEPVDDPA